MTLLFAGGVVGTVTGTLLSRPLSSIFREKKHLYIAGHCWYAIFTSYVIILRLFDLLPPNSDPIIAPLYIISGAISGIGLGAAIPLTSSMIADVTDEHERKYKRRQEGIYFAAASFAGKAIGGSGAIIAGLIIDFSGIPQGAEPATVPSESILRFGWALGPAVILMTMLAILCIAFSGSAGRRIHKLLMKSK